MGSRFVMSMIGLVLLVVVAEGCGTSEPASSRDVRQLATQVMEAASASPASTPVSSPAPAFATPEGTPQLTSSLDPALAKRALDHVRARKIVRSGTPKVLLARMGPARVINQVLGQAFVNYSPSCDYEVGLVILTGDFDVSGYAPGFGDAGPALMKYVALIYDPNYGFGGIIASPNGAGFKHALNDPSLPDLSTPAASPIGTPGATPAATPEWHYWPCPANPSATPTMSKPSAP